MNKFKVGDKVRCIDPHAGCNFEVGESGTVTALSTYVRVKHPQSGYVANFFPSQLELVLGPIKPQNSIHTLPSDSNERKNYPLFRGCLRYFPAALAGVARTSKLGNDKHNPGEEMSHARGKSTDHGDCILRHLIDVGDLLAAMDRGDSRVSKDDVLNEVNQAAWRVLAFSQELHEKFGAPLAPGANKPNETKGN